MSKISNRKPLCLYLHAKANITSPDLLKAVRQFGGLSEGLIPILDLVQALQENGCDVEIRVGLSSRDLQTDSKASAFSTSIRDLQIGYGDALAALVSKAEKRGKT